MGILRKINIRLYTYRYKIKLFFPKLKFRRNICIKEFNLENVEDDLVIYMMCGHDTIYEAIGTYISIQRFYHKYFKVLILDDGTLNNKDEIKLNKSIKHLKVVYKKEADELFGNFLKDKPELGNLSELRENLIFGPRLIDIHLLISGKRILQLDTDVLFLNYPDFLLNAIAKNEQSFLFNLDIKNSYSGELNDIIEKSKIEIHEKFNGGLSLYVSDLNELTFYSDMISKGVPKIDFYYWEQTLFALMMTKNNAISLPDEYDLHFRYKGYNTLNVPSRHYCGDSRVNYYTDYFTKVQN